MVWTGLKARYTLPVYTGRIYGPYIRVSKMTPVYTARIYGRTFLHFFLAALALTLKVLSHLIGHGTAPLGAARRRDAPFRA